VLKPKRMFQPFFHSVGWNDSTVYQRISAWETVKSPDSGLIDSGKEKPGTRKPLAKGFAADVHREVIAFKRRFKDREGTEEWNDARDEMYADLGGNPPGYTRRGTGPAIIDQKLRQAPEAA